MSKKDTVILSKLTIEQATEGVSFIQTQINFLSWVHVVFLICWSTSGILPFFSNGWLHIFPICWEVLVLKVISEAIGFGTKTLSILLTEEIQKRIYLIWAAIGVLVVAVVLNIIHFAFSVLEILDCETQLCNLDYWFLFVFLFIIPLLFCLELFLIYLMWKYKRYLYLTSEKLKQLGIRKKKNENRCVLQKEWQRDVLFYCSWTQTCLIVVWYGLSYTNDFGQGIFHITPAGFELLVLKIVSDALTFGIVCEGLNKQILLDLKLTKDVISLVFIFLAVAIAINVTHAVFAFLEYDSCQTILCTTNSWNLIMLFVILIGLSIFETIMFIVFSFYKSFIQQVQTDIYDKSKQP